ncbi:hypothetical protein PENSPDRAFT_750390 [Peniophora sp. CONT]|nr:hypothetical protein PENSPDRAFT_750390 [Peniophora sp. CONT]
MALRRYIKRSAKYSKPLSIAQTLPVEVLCMIYNISADINPPRYIQKKKKPYLCCVLLTHVCSRWRNIGLNFSHFWGKIVSSLPAATGVFLERARNAPLTILPGDGYIGASDAARSKQYLTIQALAHLHSDRIACFDLIHTYHDPRIYNDDWLSVLEMPGFGRSLTTLVLLPHVRLPTDSAGGRTMHFKFPHLRYLRYHQPEIIFVAPSLSSLALDMSGPEVSARFQPTMFTAFLDTVRHAPHLRELRFAIDDLPSHAKAAFTEILTRTSASDAIVLPSLRHIGLDGSLRFCSKVLSSITAPPNATIHYYVREICVDENTEFMSQAISLLHCMRPQLSHSGHESLALGISYRKLDIGLSCLVNIDRVWPAKSHVPHICISMRFRRKGYPLEPDQTVTFPAMEVMRVFLHLLHANSIQKMDLSLCRAEQSAVIDAIRTCTFPSLEELTLDIASPAYLRALVWQPSIAPALCRLRITNARYERSRKRWRGYWSSLAKDIEASDGRITSVHLCGARFVYPNQYMSHIWANEIRFLMTTLKGIRRIERVGGIRETPP